MSGHGVGRELVHVAGATLAYTQEGVGTPLLVVGSSIFYPRTFSEELRRYCSLVCADLPHFTPLESNFPYSSINFDVYAECIEAVRIHAGLGRVVVIGHSHHGNVALEYAKRFPQNVSHVVLIGTPPVNIDATVRAAGEYWAKNATPERRQTLERRRSSLIDAIQSAALSPKDSYILHYVADAPLYWNDPDYDAAWLWAGMTFTMDAIRAFRSLFQEYELSWDAESLDAPVLAVMGGSDFAVPHTLWNQVLPRLQGVTLQVLNDCGHTPQLERPEKFDHLVLNWLEGSSRGKLV